MKDLKSVSFEEQKKFLNSFDHFIADVDGVILRRVQFSIPGSLEAIQNLRRLDKKIGFLSNNTTKPVQFYVQQLQKLEYIIDEDELITPTLAMIDYLKNRNVTKPVYVVGTANLKKELENAGFTIIDASAEPIEETAGNLVKKITPSADVGAVIVDADINLTFIRIQLAAIYAKNPDVIFISGATDREVHIDPKYPTLLGPGYFLSIVEDFTGRKAHALAKPSKEMSKYLCQKMNIQDPSRVLFCGDSIAEDMGFAVSSNFKKLLVLSGLATKADLENWKFAEALKPDYYVESLKDLNDVIQSVSG